MWWGGRRCRRPSPCRVHGGGLAEHGAVHSDGIIGDGIFSDGDYFFYEYNTKQIQ